MSSSPERGDHGRLARELGVPGATMLGLGSILGTGVFVSIGVAAGVAGPAVLAAIVLAAGLAVCNALSSAQLAATYPVSGGTYEYGYRLLRPELGFVAGWVFLCAKSASAATAALGAVGYLAHLLGIQPGGALGTAAAALAVAVTVLVLGGLRRSSAVNIGIVSVTVLALAAFAGAGLVRLASGAARPFTPVLPDANGGAGPLLYATALMFVAYTGYARIATLGEEVREPARTIPRAIVVTLAVSAALYLLVAVAALGAVPPDVLAGAAETSAVPLEAAARAMDVPVLGTLVALGAVTAMLGVLLNLLLGLSRVALAMGRRRDLPPAFARLTRSGTPRLAVGAAGAVVAAIASLGEIEITWAFSAFTVLLYYAITNLAALRLPEGARLYPPAVAWTGLVGCLGLTAFLPGRVWILGAVLVGAGLVWHVITRILWPEHRT